MKLRVRKGVTDTAYWLQNTIRKNGKVNTVSVYKIGTYNELIKTHENPEQYAIDYVADINKKIKENKSFVLSLPIDVNKGLKSGGDAKNTKGLYLNVGYMYLEEIYNELKIKEFFNEILKDSKVKYNANDINKLLTFSRILDPQSKSKTYDNKESYLGKFDVEQHQIYRFLDVLAANSDKYQQYLYKQSKKIISRNTSVLYYDCTNFFFEIETQDENTYDSEGNLLGEGLRKYGKSKENRPLPIVQMGLFMDANGIPLGFSITPGNTNEQKTVKPLETKIMKDFNLSKFVYCADAGLGSTSIKVLNNSKNKAFVVTQSLKKLKADKQKEIFNDKGWRNLRTGKIKNISDIENNDKDTYFKQVTVERKIDVGLSKYIGKREVTDYAVLKERIIVTYQKKYDLYQKKIRKRQIDDAMNKVDNNIQQRPSQNSPNRLIKSFSITPDGELAKKKFQMLDVHKIEKEEKYDGYYALSTNLEDTVESILKINSRRWEIEESFRIMKSNFKARPTYLSNKNRIIAHFLTCFTSLLIYRIFEHRVEELDTKEKFSVGEIIDNLQKMTVTDEFGLVYHSQYLESDFTLIMERISKINLSHEFIFKAEMKKILKNI